jgi:hypothetical protein
MSSGTGSRRDFLRESASRESALRRLFDCVDVGESVVKASKSVEMLLEVP